MYLSYPLSFPVAKLLDNVLGHDEGVTYKRAGLKTFVSLHRHLGAENLLEDEVTIISSVLELSEKSIRDIMVPVDDIYSLSSEQILDEDTVTEVGQASDVRYACLSRPPPDSEARLLSRTGVPEAEQAELHWHAAGQECTRYHV